MPEIRITPYLTFNGNCREAMSFYQKCLGGELHFQSLEDSPFSDHMSEPMKKTILHATLTIGETSLFASDMVPEDGLSRGNHISLALICNSKKEVNKIYENLSAGGQKTTLLTVSCGNGMVGELTDRYGKHWLVHCHLKN